MKSPRACGSSTTIRSKTSRAPTKSGRASTTSAVKAESQPSLGRLCGSSRAPRGRSYLGRTAMTLAVVLSLTFTGTPACKTGTKTHPRTERRMSSSSVFDGAPCISTLSISPSASISNESFRWKTPFAFVSTYTGFNPHTMHSIAPGGPGFTNGWAPAVGVVPSIFPASAEGSTRESAHSSCAPTKHMTVRVTAHFTVNSGFGAKTTRSEDSSKILSTKPDAARTPLICAGAPATLPVAHLDVVLCVVPLLTVRRVQR